jgi:ubiquinone/menaquinone biosynthesis C-methylase UbiE
MISDSSVRIVTSRRAIQHVDDDLRVFKEINRVLTPDGIAVIEVAGLLNSSVSKFLNYLKIKKYRYNIFHIYTKSNVEKKISQSGLRLLMYSKATTKRPFHNHIIIVMKGESIENKSNQTQ